MEEEKQDIKILKIMIMIISCIIFTILGIIVSFIILVDKVYAKTYEEFDFNLIVKNSLCNNNN